MRVLFINSVCGYGSTGRICIDLANMLENTGHTCCIAFGRGKVPNNYKGMTYKICNFFSNIVDVINTRLFDSAGLNNKRNTLKFIKWIKTFAPDVVHLHNLHGYYLNISLLLNFLKKERIKVIYSLYDCWPFTGHCAHFDFNKCEGWKTGCQKCHFFNEYPKSFVSHSKRNYEIKMKAFEGFKNIHIVVPSKWLYSIVKSSFLKAYPIKVIPNGIDLSIFNCLYESIDAKRKDKEVVLLGVSSVWTDKKGLSCFNELAERLPNHYKLVLLGKKRLFSKFSKNIIHIPRIESLSELREIYTSADIFLNLTLEETQGLTTLEALACGIPSIVFNSGGACECLNDVNGIIVKSKSVDEVLAAIESIIQNKSKYDRTSIRNTVLKYDKNILNQNYYKMYLYYGENRC